jgi:hypothetical protein
MGEFTNFQVNQQVALQNAVVEYQIDIEVVCVKLQALLPTDKGEAFAKFEQEGLKVLNNRRFK